MSSNMRFSPNVEVLKALRYLLDGRWRGVYLGAQRVNEPSKKGVNA
jgi:hypothetical protein